MGNKIGYFVISLDFELLYGMNDRTNLALWIKNTTGARMAISKMLQLFETYGIQATWAVVGMLYAENKEQWLDAMPSILPHYTQKNFSNYEQIDLIGEDELTDPLHYAPTLIKKIEETEGQELASHTFSHYYCMGQGQKEEAFEEDMKAALRMAKSHGTTVKSFVFPKNQFNDAYLRILDKYGITAVRGNEESWMYRATGTGENIAKRAIRLLDSYINISGNHCHQLEDLKVMNGVVNIPSSRFLRPFHRKLALVENIKVARIKRQMRYAAKYGKIFHLWWHPHNFGDNQTENMDNLKKILDYYKLLQKKYKYKSVTMGEVAKIRLSLRQEGID